MARTLTVADAIPLLEVHPRRIAAATAGIASQRLRNERMLGEWTANDVLAHLRCCADVCIDVVPRILAEPRPRLRVIGPRDLIEQTGYRDLEFAGSLRAFARQRSRLVAMLRKLPRADWARGAYIGERGRWRERTVQEYADWLARHEERHVEHFERFGRVQARKSR